MNIIKYNIILLNLFCFISYTLSKKSHLLDLSEESYQLEEINRENFLNTINNNNFFFLFIHNPWCSWSQKVEKKLTNINLYLKLEKQKKYLGIIDHTTQNDISYITDYIKENNINSN